VKLPCRLGEEALSNAKGMENDVRASKSPMIIVNCATLVILSEDSVSAPLLPSKPAAGISGSPVKHGGKPGMDHTRLYLPFGWFSTTHASYWEEDAIVSLAKDRALNAEFSAGDNVRSSSYVIDRIGNKSSLRLNSNVSVRYCLVAYSLLHS
jgi:hypothetical protein